MSALNLVPGFVAPAPSPVPDPSATDWITRILGNVGYTQNDTGTTVRIGGIVLRRDNSGNVEVWNEHGVDGAVSRGAAALNLDASRSQSALPIIAAGGLLVWLLWG